MDNRTIEEVRNNETKLIKEIEILEEENEKLKMQNQKYKEAVNKIKKICESTPPDWSICGIEVVSRIENVLKEVE